jgi:hypothetical protein
VPVESGLDAAVSENPVPLWSGLDAAVSENPVPLVRGSPPSRRRVDVEFWAMELFQHVEFLSVRKMIGVEYLARFASCLIEKGLDKVENW